MALFTICPSLPPINSFKTIVMFIFKRRNMSICGKVYNSSAEWLLNVILNGIHLVKFLAKKLPQIEQLTRPAVCAARRAAPARAVRELHGSGESQASLLIPSLKTCSRWEIWQAKFCCLMSLMRQPGWCIVVPLQPLIEDIYIKYQQCSSQSAVNVPIGPCILGAASTSA